MAQLLHRVFREKTEDLVGKHGGVHAIKNNGMQNLRIRTARFPYLNHTHHIIGRHTCPLNSGYDYNKTDSRVPFVSLCLSVLFSDLQERFGGENEGLRFMVLGE